MTWKPWLAVTTLALFGLRGILAHALPAIGLPVFAIDLGASDVEFLKWSLTQGGLSFLLMWVLYSYRRDFFRKVERKEEEIEALRDDKRMLANVIEKNAAAMQQQALAVAANTKATETLAQNVFELAGRRHEGRQ